MDELKFEDALERLEAIVQQLESGQLSLEESLDVFEEGVKLAVSCQQQLRRADGRVKRLVKRIDGDMELQDFEE
jgi:exodeoxyribonuclease VII small subunit